jgi:polysaccharide export outer membrane protein
MERFSRRMSLVTLVMLVALTAGCGNNERLKAFLNPTGPSLDEPETIVAVSDYRVMPPDVLSVQSVRVLEINNTFQQVRPDGKINLPLLGEVAVAGKTPADIEALICEKATKFYKETDATVQVRQYLSQNIYVFGQVARPGPQAWNGANTLIDVLANAQPSTLAWPERIRLVRGGSPSRGGFDPKVEQIDGADKSTVMIVNLLAMVEKGDLSKNVLLKPDDVVYVPPNPLAAIGLAVQQILLPIRPAVETVAAPAGAARAVNIAGGVP